MNDYSPETEKKIYIKFGAVKVSQYQTVREFSKSLHDLETLWEIQNIISNRLAKWKIYLTFF